MPAFASHYILSDQIYQYLQKDSPTITALIKNNRAAYNWGAQGPDLLYFYKIWNPDLRLADFGNLMHTQKTSELFYEMSSYILSQKDKANYEMLCAYFFGFISHYAFDSTLHPYVYYLQNVQYQKKPKYLPLAHHNFIECGIDSLLYLRYYGKPVTRLNTRTAFSAPHDLKKELGKLYYDLLQNVYGINQDMKPLCKCVGSASRLSRLLFDRTYYLLTRIAGIAAYVLPTQGMLQSIIHKKHAPESLLNIDRQPWHYMNEPKHICCDSVMDLYDKAFSFTINRILAYHQILETGKLISIPYIESFSEGKITTDADCGRFKRYAFEHYAAEDGGSVS